MGLSGVFVGLSGVVWVNQVFLWVNQVFLDPWIKATPPYRTLCFLCRYICIIYYNMIT